MQQISESERGGGRTPGRMSYSSKMIIVLKGRLKMKSKFTATCFTLTTSLHKISNINLLLFHHVIGVRFMGGKSTAAFMVAIEYVISKAVLGMDILKECAFCIADKDP